MPGPTCDKLLPLHYSGGIVRQLTNHFIMRLNISHFILLFALTLLSACGSGESNVVQGNRDGILHFGNGSEPQGLDPHVVTGVPENHLIRALFEGLAVKNPYTLEPEPGVAES